MKLIIKNGKKIGVKRVPEIGEIFYHSINPFFLVRIDNNCFNYIGNYSSDLFYAVSLDDGKIYSYEFSDEFEIVEF